MSKLLYSLVLLFSLITGYAQTPIGGIINDYAAVISLADADCFNAIEVDDASAFAVGDRALLIQMNGATINQSNTSSFGNVVDLQSAGLFEIVTIDSIDNNTVYFPDSLINDYDDQAVQQLVRIPQYTDAIVASVLTAKPWDGQTGGIVILEASGNLFVQSNIDVTGQGFRGDNNTRNGGGPCPDDYFLPSNSTIGARKGESIAILDPSQQSARGRSANGGGGGNMHNAGGGGGSGAGAGGKGGDACNQCCGNFSPDRGGLGGQGLGAFTNRLFMGGGGGQGQQNDNSNLKAGSGGGIIILRAAQIFMQGGRVMAVGESGESSNQNDFPTDGHPGGGGGGTVLLDAANITGFAVFEAWGGNGGNNNTIGSEGPGGGGGGGVVIDIQNSLPPLSAVIITGGNAGTTRGGFGQNHGARDGQIGRRVTSFNIPESTMPFELLEDLQLVVDNQRPCAGDAISFSSTALPVHPDITYSWTGPGLGSVTQGNLDISGITVQQSGDYTLEATLGCVSMQQTITIEVLPEYDVLIDTFICEGEQFEMGNAFYATTGFYQADLQTVAGCDSTVQLDLQVIPPFFDTTFIQLCNGETYEGDTYTNDTLLLASLSSSIGCDSFDYTSIQIFPTYNRTSFLELCAGDNFNGVTVNSDTTIVDNNQTAFGCDSITTFEISVFPGYDYELTEEICAGDTYRGVVYSRDTVLVENLQTLAGCDSIVTTNLTVHPEYDIAEQIDLCSGETYLGTTYTSSTVLVNNFSTNAGCDSTVTSEITVYPVYDDIQFPEICSGETFNGLVYFRDTVLVDNNQTLQGCDSITTFNLRVNPVYDYDLFIEVCEGDTYRGSVYLRDAVLIETLQTLAGCDSIVTTNITVYPEYDFIEQIDLCSGETYLGTSYTSSTVLVNNYLTNTGCDSTVTSEITVYPVYDEVFFPEICAGETFNGNVYFRDTVLIDNNQTVQGCDSTTTFNLRVHPVYDYDQFNAVCEGDAYRGSVYLRDTVLVENLQTLRGCDSTVTTFLTINPTYDLMESVDLCEGESYQGVVYSNSTVITNNFLTSRGCDSVVTTTITVYPTYNELNSVAICENELYNGQSFSRDTVIIEAYQTVEGCDSLIQTAITVHPLPQPQISGGLGGFCLGETLVLSLNGTDQQILWSTGDTIDQIEISDGGTYSVIVTNRFGCSASASIDIPEPVAISANIEFENPECFGDETGSIVVETPQGGISPFMYSLNGEPFSSRGLWGGLPAGQYKVVIQDAFGCELSEVITLTTPPPVSISISNQSNFEIKLGDSLALTAQVNQSLSDIQWSPSSGISCDTCLSVRFSPLQTTEYQLSVTNTNGCSETTTIRINVDERPDIYAPNVFSPNGDGLNDGFTIFAGKAVQSIERMIVMDRWGAVVFERGNFPPNDESLGWDGSRGGDMLNPGVFVFHAELLLLDGRKTKVSGDLTLVR